MDPAFKARVEAKRNLAMMRQFRGGERILVEKPARPTPKELPAQSGVDLNPTYKSRRLPVDITFDKWGAVVVKQP